MTIGWIKFILKNKNKAHYTILKLQLFIPMKNSITILSILQFFRI